MAKQRYHLLDVLRGLCILFVIIYHLIYDLSEIFGGNYTFLYSAPMEFFRIGTVAVFILVSGISCHFSKSNIKRGMKTLFCALLITATTAILLPSELIIFGILHFLAVSMLLYALLQKILKPIPFQLGFIICLVLLICANNITQNISTPDHFIFYVLGFATGHHSADYYPLLPWVFLFFAGTFLGRLFQTNLIPKFFSLNFAPPLAYIGRHTLLIYLLHQPIIYGVLFLYFTYFA